MRDMARRKVTRRDMRREATKAAVLDAAEAVFLSRGFDGATIKMIADEAGVSPGTVLNAEPTKAALLVAILRGATVQVYETVEQLEGALSGSACDRLGALMRVVLDGHLHHTELFAAAIGHTWLDGGMEFQTAFTEMGFAWGPMRRVVEAGMKSGEFCSDLDIEPVLHVLQEIVFSAIREAARQGGCDPNEVLTSRLNVILTGLKT